MNWQPEQSGLQQILQETEMAEAQIADYLPPEFPRSTALHTMEAMGELSQLL